MNREAFNATEVALTKAEGLAIALGSLAIEGSILNVPGPEAQALRTLIDLLGETVAEVVKLHEAQLAPAKA